MSKSRTFFQCAAALIAAFGICSQQELKAQEMAAPVAHLVRVGQVDALPADGFDAGAGMYQGIVLMGPNPPTLSPSPTWPCFGGGGDSECSSLPAGGVIIPFPQQVFGPRFVGEVVSTFSTTSATGTADITVTITEGAATLFTYSSSVSVAANGDWYIYLENVSFTGATKGTATLTVTTTVGTAIITGKAALHIS
jgi:hypothetical protein